MKKLSLLTSAAYIFAFVSIIWISLLYFFEKIAYMDLFKFLLVCCSVFCLSAIVCRFARFASSDFSPSEIKKRIEKLEGLRKDYLNIALLFLFAILIMSFVALCNLINL